MGNGLCNGLLLWKHSNNFSRRDAVNFSQSSDFILLQKAHCACVQKSVFLLKQERRAACIKICREQATCNLQDPKVYKSSTTEADTGLRLLMRTQKLILSPL